MATEPGRKPCVAGGMEADSSRARQAVLAALALAVAVYTGLQVCRSVESVLVSMLYAENDLW